jgi:hypothetical protein
MAAAIVLLAACKKKDERTIAEVHDAVVATITARTGNAGEPLCELRVTKPSPFTHDLGERCRTLEYRLVADPEGKRLAYRPVQWIHADDWTVVYFGTGGRTFVGGTGRGPAAPEDPIDWSKIPPLEAALEPMFRVAPRMKHVEEIRARQGDRGVVKLLVGNVDVAEENVTEWPCPTATRSTWRTAFDALAPPEQEQVRRGIEPRLADTRVEPVVLERLAAVIDPDAARIRPHVDRLLELGATTSEHAKIPRRAYAFLLLRRAARDPNGAAKLACSRIRNDLAPETHHADVRAAHFVIARSETPCPATDEPASPIDRTKATVNTVDEARQYVCDAPAAPSSR